MKNLIGEFSKTESIAIHSIFDAVLLDIELPGLSGLKAIDAFTSESKAAVFLMTGHSDSEIEKDALLLGAKGFFPKPLDFDAVLAAITSLPKR